MAFLGFLDVADESSIQGWAHSDTLPNLTIHVDVLVNRRCVAKLLADSYRWDVEAAGFGNGRKGFGFNPVTYLTLPENIVEVYISGTDQLLHNGQRMILTARAKAESRWRDDEEDISLTWGSIMTGETFFDEVEKHFRFTPDISIVEIGPGYGRLLKTMLDREHPFRSFHGLDLSEPRISKLKRQFTDDRIHFETGNCTDFVFSEPFDVAFCSATLEHLFPSIEPTLVNLRSQIKANGMVFLDFIMQDEALSTSKAYFEDESRGGAYIRVYSQQELEDFFELAGFRITALQPIVLGKGSQGESIKRCLVSATPR